MFLRAGVFSVVFATALLASGGALAANQSVMTLPDNTFSPASVTVNVGESVTWTNSGGNHNVVLSDGNVALNAPSTGGWTVSRTFDQAGTFGYYCEIHRGVGMTGTVTVLAPGTPPPSGPPQNTPPTGNPPSNGPGSPAKKKALAVSFKVSDATPLAGKRIRLSGVVKPARDGRKVLVQKRLRSGKYRTIATARLKHAAGGKSTFSVRVRVSATATLRVKIAGDGERATGLSKTKKIRVQRP
jgi:plastocyanin